MLDELAAAVATVHSEAAPSATPVAWALVLGTTLMSAREVLVLELPVVDRTTAMATDGHNVGQLTRGCLRRLVGAMSERSLPDPGTQGM